MSHQRIAIRYLSALLFLITAVLPVHAINRGSTSSGIAFVSGGIGHTELLMLSEEKKNYSFWLTTAAKGSGAYLAGVHIRIVNAKTRQPVLEHHMDGPWLFAALPVGRYDVEASYKDVMENAPRMLKKSTTIHAKDRHQMLLYFDTRDTVGADDDATSNLNRYNTN